MATTDTRTTLPAMSVTLSPAWTALSQHAFHEVQPTHLRNLLADSDRCAALHTTLPLADPYRRAAGCVPPPHPPQHFTASSRLPLPRQHRSAMLAEPWRAWIRIARMRVGAHAPNSLLDRSGAEQLSVSVAQTHLIASSLQRTRPLCTCGWVSNGRPATPTSFSVVWCCVVWYDRSPLGGSPPETTAAPLPASLRGGCMACADTSARGRRRMRPLQRGPPTAGGGVGQRRIEHSGAVSSETTTAWGAMSRAGTTRTVRQAAGS